MLARSDAQITIFHNPGCSTSRRVLDAIRAAGHAPEIVPYLETGWDRAELTGLLAAMGLGPRDVLRRRGPAEALGLLEPDVSDAAILEAMLAHPVLVERPIVRTPKGVRLCRPAERLGEIL